MRLSDFILDARLTFMESPDSPDSIIAFLNKNPNNPFRSLYINSATSETTTSTQNTFEKLYSNAQYLNFCRTLAKRENDVFTGAKLVCENSTQELLNGTPSVDSTYAFNNDGDTKKVPSTTSPTEGLDVWEADNAILKRRSGLNKIVSEYLTVLIDPESNTWAKGFLEQFSEWQNTMNKEDKLLSYAKDGNDIADHNNTARMTEQVADILQSLKLIEPMLESVNSDHPMNRWLSNFKQLLDCQNKVIHFMLDNSSNSQDPREFSANKEVQDLLNHQRNLIGKRNNKPLHTPWRDCVMEVKQYVNDKPVGMNISLMSPLFFDRAMETKLEGIKCFETDSPPDPAKYDPAKDVQGLRSEYGVSFGGALWQYLNLAHKKNDFQRTRTFYNFYKTKNVIPTSPNPQIETKPSSPSPENGFRQQDHNSQNNTLYNKCTPFLYPIDNPVDAKKQARRTIMVPYIQDRDFDAYSKSKGGGFFDFFNFFGSTPKADANQVQEDETYEADANIIKRCQVSDSLFLSEFLAHCIWPAPKIPGTEDANECERFYFYAKEKDNDDQPQPKQFYPLTPQRLLQMYQSGSNDTYTPDVSTSRQSASSYNSRRSAPRDSYRSGSNSNSNSNSSYSRSDPNSYSSSSLSNSFQAD